MNENEHQSREYDHHVHKMMQDSNKMAPGPHRAISHAHHTHHDGMDQLNAWHF